MTALSAGAPHFAQDVDGLRRYTTRIKAIVHSHNHTHGPLDLSDDVMAANLGKNLKGVGRANLTLVGRLGYINMLYPNDYLNVYFDIGDGNGWTRTFFGLLDRIEEEYSVDDSGVPTTLYHVIASDFQKVFEKTNIYFNPHLFRRADVAGEDFNAFNIGGVALLTRGIHLQGSPADMVLNQILLQIGFGSQWRLPDSYPVRLEDRFKEQRAQYAQNRLFESVSNTLEPQDIERLRAVLRERDSIQGTLEEDLSTNAGESLSSESEEERVTAALEAAKLDRADIMEGEFAALRSASDATQMAAALSDARLRQQLYGSGLSATEQSAAQTEINRYEAFDERRSLNRNIIDLMNVFDFVERRAIDGYAFDLPLWERQGPLSGILKSVSNEVINELIFDLRPINVPPTNSEESSVYLASGTDWDRSSDEIGGNDADETSGVPGIRYMPSVIMREYPFSTVNYIDARGVSVTVGNNDGQSGNLGIMHFGGVFANRPNEPGRHLVATPVLNLEERVQGIVGEDRTYKHLDVAVISETEIRKTSWGRSDEEHFNLFEMWTDGISGSDMRYYMYDFLPIITPIHVQRHGLRVRTITTRFSRYPPSVVNRTQPQTVRQAAEEAPEEESPATSGDTSLVAPVGAHPSLRFTNQGFSKYGYRARDLVTRDARSVLAGRTVPDKNVWRFHAGVDIGGAGPTESFEIQGRGNTQGPVDVVAIADGLIVASIATGTRGMDYYGNIIIIYHPQFEAPEAAPTIAEASSLPQGRAIFSAYAHLAHREPFTGNADGVRSLSVSANHNYLGLGGDFTPVPVRKGQKIGSVGNTAGTRNNPVKVFSTARAHLHFEINFQCPPKNESAAGSPLIPYTRKGNPLDVPIPSLGLAAGPITPIRGTRPTGGNPNGMDPVQFFADHGVDLVAEITRLRGGGAPEADESTEADEDAVDHDDPDAPPSRVSQGQEEDETTTTRREARRQPLRGAVDTVDMRQQLGRWALLQDHWYQHNLEYVSGTLTMRPAPEIRIGQRLDILERRMSFYVEGVQHQWNYPNELMTTLQITRGQPNNPFPVYALPPLDGFDMPTAGRRGGSRLSHYFIVPDPLAIRRAIALRAHTPGNTNTIARPTDEYINYIDDDRFFESLGFSSEEGGLLPPDATEFTTVDDPLTNLLNAVDGLTEEEIREKLRSRGLAISDDGNIVRDEDVSDVEAPTQSGATDGALGSGQAGST